MEVANQLFAFLTQYGIVLCKQCHFAVVPSQVTVHLRVHHPYQTQQQRKAIQEEVDQAEGIAFEKDQVLYPGLQEPPIPGLPVFKDGFACKACIYICRSKRGIQEHCKDQHRWSNPQKRGRQKKGAEQDKMWKEGQHCQRFFEFAQWKRYFQVSNQLGQNRQYSNIGISNATMERFADEIEESMAQKRKEREIEGSSSRYLPNPWLDFVGWDEHLKKFRRSELLEMTEAREEKRPDHREQDREERAEEQEERGLAQACVASQRLIRRAMAICQPSIVGRSALEFVNRREVGEVKNERPFYARQKASTLRKYTAVWAKVLRYIWRSSSRPEQDKPSYRLTREQEEELEGMKAMAKRWEEERGSQSISRQERSQQKEHQLEQMEELCLRFWIAMFDHELKAGEFENGIISALAVLGLNSEKEGWSTAMNYTPVLSAVVTITRGLVVYRAWLTHQDAVQEAVERGIEEREARERAPSIFEEVKEMVQRFMTLTVFDGMPSPMDRILHMRTYGMKIRFSTKGEGRVVWKGEEICIDKISFSMEELRGVVHGLNESVRKRLMEDLLCIEGGREGGERARLPRLDLGELYDNPAELTEGWSFLNDSRSQWEVDGKKWMFKRLSREAELEEKFIQGGLDGVERWDQIQWKQKGVEDYFRRVSRFKEELLALVHLTAGAPARGTEVLSIQHTNGDDSRAQRGIFVENGLVAFVTTYHKGYSSSQKVKVIHRYVPQEVGEMVVYYLWLVEPFVRQLQMMARDQGVFSTFMWEPEPEEEYAEEEFEEDSEEEFEEESQEGEDEQRDEDEEQGEEELNGDGEETEREGETARNVDGFWGTDRVRRVLQKQTGSRIGVKISTAIWRQVYPAIQREWSQERGVQEMLDEIYEGKGRGEENDWESRQAGHSRWTEEMIYGILMSESPFQTRSERERFRKVSMDWHRFLHFLSAWGEAGGKDLGSREKHDEEQRRQEMQRWQKVRATDRQQVLQRIAGQGAEFRGMQQAGLEAITNRVARVMLIMRTGGGKSLFFMVPAASSREGVSIVVVPLISLREDLRDRCSQAGIRCAEWDGRSPPFWASIVLVTPESAVTKAFSRFINQKKMMRQLDRIVIDECHVVLESTDKWRPQMKQLVEMGEKGTQVVYLTATLPPADEGRFLQVMGMKRGEVQILRDVTTRPNIQYSVVEFEREEEEEAVKELVERKKRENPSPGQVIIYAKSVEQTKRLAQVLGCQAYFREVGSEEKKREILQSLVRGRQQVFVTTNALGLGIDAPNIRVVIHMGIRARMTDYAQESGRAGRDGQKSEAIILRGCWSKRNGERVQDSG